MNTPMTFEEWQDSLSKDIVEAYKKFAEEMGDVVPLVKPEEVEK